mmetsp:Transcript_9012/g.22746  ORF Transcript_9012/g.22746 Transcript_9012/m.22746 type:complete len:230 (-) Transcript_9012:3533-4222(-)
MLCRPLLTTKRSWRKFRQCRNHGKLLLLLDRTMMLLFNQELQQHPNRRWHTHGTTRHSRRNNRRRLPIMGIRRHITPRIIIHRTRRTIHTLLQHTMYIRRHIMLRIILRCLLIILDTQFSMPEVDHRHHRGQLSTPTENRRHHMLPLFSSRTWRGQPLMGQRQRRSGEHHQQFQLSTMGILLRLTAHKSLPVNTRVTRKQYQKRRQLRPQHPQLRTQRRSRKNRAVAMT